MTNTTNVPLDLPPDPQQVRRQRQIAWTLVALGIACAVMGGLIYGGRLLVDWVGNRVPAAGPSTGPVADAGELVIAVSPAMKPTFDRLVTTFAVQATDEDLLPIRTMDVDPQKMVETSLEAQPPFQALQEAAQRERGHPVPARLRWQFRLPLSAPFQDVHKGFQAREQAGSAGVFVKAQRQDRDLAFALQRQQGIVGHHLRRAAKGRQVDHTVHPFPGKARRIPHRTPGKAPDIPRQVRFGCLDALDVLPPAQQLFLEQIAHRFGEPETAPYVYAQPPQLALHIHVKERFLHRV